MNTASIAPEVEQFAAAVRTRLADLTPDEREELAGGLEADLADLVEERGVEALGDPVAYAEELRSAAGLGPAMGTVRVKRSAGETVDGWLDAAHERWDRAVTGLPGSLRDVVVSLGPAWWVLRAYVAVQSVRFWAQGDYTLTWLPAFGLYGLVALAIATVVSVQIGLRRWWPGKSGVVGRLVLLGLNLFAVAMSLVVLNSVPNVSQQYVDGVVYGNSGYSGAGLTNNGSEVTNVYPYDAKGQPLVGVQLFDQYGDPLKVDEYVQGGDYSTWAYPWTNVNGAVWNTFPMPEAPYDTNDYCCDRMPSPWTSETPPTFQRPPLDQVPSVTIPDAAYGESEAQETTPERTPQGKNDEKSGRKPGR